MDDAYQGLNRLPAKSGGLMSFMSVERIIDGPWDVFEKTILRLLIHTGWKQVIHTGRSGDMGADIIGIDTTGKKVVLQCKFKRSTTSIGKSAVDELRNVSKKKELNEELKKDNQLQQAVALLSGWEVMKKMFKNLKVIPSNPDSRVSMK